MDTANPSETERTNCFLSHTHDSYTYSLLASVCLSKHIRSFKGRTFLYKYPSLWLFNLLQAWPWSILDYLSTRKRSPKNILQRYKALNSSTPESCQLNKVFWTSLVCLQIKTKYAKKNPQRTQRSQLFILQILFFLSSTVFKHWLSTLSIKI